MGTSGDKIVLLDGMGSGSGSAANGLLSMIPGWKNPVGDRIPMGFLFARNFIMITFVRGRSFCS